MKAERTIYVSRAMAESVGREVRDQDASR